MGVGKNVIKFLMFSFNFIFFIGGCGILGLGIWLKVEKDDYAELSQYNFISASNIAIIVGVIIVLVAFLGCCGAINEVAPMLLAFFVLMLIIFILEVTAGALAYTKRSEITDELSTEFRAAIKEKYGTVDKKHEGLSKAIDKFQNHFECCGYNGHVDWKGSNYTKRTGSIPHSCCMKDKKKDKLCGQPDPASMAIYNKKGCFTEVMTFLKQHLLYVGGLGVALALIQILGLIFSMTLYCSIRNEGKGTYA